MDLIESPRTTAAEETERQRARLPRRHRAAYDALIDRTAGLQESVVRLLAVRIADLIHHAGRTTTAERYVARVLATAVREEQVRPGSVELTSEVARYLFKVLAYKDEYEVARLYLEPVFADHVSKAFTDAVSVSYNLSPPAARLFGRTRKLHLGPWFRAAFRMLRAGRRLRGTWLDPFRLQASRREERGLITWYEQILDDVDRQLSPATFGTAVALAALPEDIRGYEDVKHRNAEIATQRADELKAQLARPRLPLMVHNPPR